MMQWNINEGPHVHSHVSSSVFLVLLPLLMPLSCCFLIRSAFISHPKLPSGKKSKFSQWDYECMTASLVCWGMLPPSPEYCLEVDDKHPKKCGQSTAVTCPDSKKEKRKAKHVSRPLGGVVLWRQWESPATALTLWPPSDRDADVKPAMETRTWYLVSLSCFPSHCILAGVL